MPRSPARSLLLVFQLLLPRSGLRAPTIVCDLVVGAAYFVLLLAVLRDLGMDPTSLVATSAVVTGILALSLQPTLGNVIGGVALQLDRSVRVGDWLRLDDGREGLVREIRWRHTVLETRNWDTLIVPNSNLLAANITILGKRAGEPLQHRMWVNFNIDFRFRPERVIEVVEDALRAGPSIAGVADRPPPDCVCMDLASDGRESYGLYAVRYWLTNLARDDPTSSQVRQRIYAALQRAGIPLAMPASQLFVDIDDPERRAAKQQQALQERLRALAAVDLLDSLTDSEREQLARALVAAPFAAGETITRQGQAAHWLYILAEGEAEVVVEHEGRSQRVATLTAPAFFGEMSLVTGAPRSATVTAITPVLCYRLYSDAFREILTARPEIAAEISQILADREAGLDRARAQLDHAPDHAAGADASHMLQRIQDFFGL